MKEVSYKDLGYELSKMVQERFKLRYDINFSYLSENTDDWMNEILHAQEEGHFEFRYNGKVEIFDLEILNGKYFIER